MIEMLTYFELADRLKCSPEAARSLAKRLRMPRSLQDLHESRTQTGQSVFADVVGFIAVESAQLCLSATRQPQPCQTVPARKYGDDRFLGTITRPSNLS